MSSIPNNVPLYEGSSLTIPSSSTLLMKYKMRHNLTKEALSDLLQLIRLHLPSPNQYPSSLYIFQKQFLDLPYPFVFHSFCAKCLGTVTSERVCVNQHCSNGVLDDNSISSFIELPVDLQLQIILKRMFHSTINTLYICII